MQTIFKLILVSSRMRLYYTCISKKNHTKNELQTLIRTHDYCWDCGALKMWSASIDVSLDGFLGFIGLPRKLTEPNTYMSRKFRMSTDTQRDVLRTPYV